MAQPWDGTAGYDVAIEVAKAPGLRESQSDGLVYGAVDDIILAAPLLAVVSNDAGDGDVVCQQVQISGGLPAGTGQYKGLYLDASNNWHIDYARFH